MGHRRHEGTADVMPLERRRREDSWDWMRRAGRDAAWLRRQAAELERFPRRQLYLLERAELIEAGVEPPEFPRFNGWGLRAV
jgi:hypothetical protein